MAKTKKKKAMLNLEEVAGNLVACFSAFGLNLGTYLSRVEAAAHSGWSIAIPAIANSIFGKWAGWIACICWSAYSLYSELICDAHLASMGVYIKALQVGVLTPECADLVTDLATKILPGVAFCWLTHKLSRDHIP